MMTTDQVVTILAGKLFDPYTLTLVENQAIRVSRTTGRVLDVVSSLDLDLNLNLDLNLSDTESGEVIDLSGLTVLPGFVDAHVHLFLHPYEERSWEDQLTKESLVERTIRATVHAKRTLLAGFTTVRDLGTEGAGDADVALRTCLASALIPGPRYFCASRAIVPTGTYGPKSVIHVDREGIEGIRGADVADGRDACIKTVRRHIGAGADWIKIYADYRVRSRMGGVSAESVKSMMTFNEDELKALIETAHMYGVKVAAHATHRETIATLITLGVDSIEHGYDILSGNDSDRRRVLRALARSTKTVWVPTLAAYYTLSGSAWTRAASAFKAALEEGMENIACGGDTGVFAHGENALEMVLMVRLGADWRKVLRWGTLGGWSCIRSMACEEDEVRFGAIRRGFDADVIATCGNLTDDFESAVSAENIQFVMKAGRVYKRDGRAVE